MNGPRWRGRLQDPAVSFAIRFPNCSERGPIDASRCWLVPDSHASFGAAILVPRTHTFFESRSRLNDDRENGLKRSALNEPLIRRIRESYFEWFSTACQRRKPTERRED